MLSRIFRQLRSEIRIAAVLVLNNCLFCLSKDFTYWGLNVTVHPAMELQTSDAIRCREFRPDNTLTGNTSQRANLRAPNWTYYSKLQEIIKLQVKEPKMDFTVAPPLTLMIARKECSRTSAVICWKRLWFNFTRTSAWPYSAGKKGTRCDKVSEVQLSKALKIN